MGILKFKNTNYKLYLLHSEESFLTFKNNGIRNTTDLIHGISSGFFKNLD